MTVAIQQLALPITFERAGMIAQPAWSFGFLGWRQPLQDWHVGKTFKFDTGRPFTYEQPMADELPAQVLRNDGRYLTLDIDGRRMVFQYEPEPVEHGDWSE